MKPPNAITGKDLDTLIKNELHAILELYDIFIGGHDWPSKYAVEPDMIGEALDTV